MKIKNPQTMTRTNKTTRIMFFALMTITLLIHTGCKPTAEQEAASPSNSNVATSSDDSNSSAVPANADSPSGSDIAAPSKTDRVTSTPESKDREAENDSVVIAGDLDSVDWDSMVGQDVAITGDLVVVDTYDLVRRGQVKVARNRLYIPTNRIDPNDADPNTTSFEGGNNVAKVTAAQKHNDKATIIIDDGSAKQNIFPPTLFPGLGKTHPTVRIGSMLKGVSGKLVKAGNNLLLVPNEPLQWTPAQRPPRPDVGKALVTVSSFNVLNYFATIDNGRNNARGADSKSEQKRQEEKLVSAIIALQADVVGLMEIENNLDAENRLVAALNKEIGQEAFKGCGLPDGLRSAPGGQDAIRVGLIYRADRVTPVGDVSMIRDDAFNKARTPIVQTFKSKTAGKPFSVIVNHFKSKGGASRADTANKNKGDGQGAYNATRRSQSMAICNYIDRRKQGDKAPRILVIGDLNAYGQEDPIDVMRAKGLVDLRERFEEERSSGNEGEHYSYIYMGQSGSMDHAMATDTMATDVTGIATWHINADEPRFLDYNQEYNPKPLFESDPFRSSDHDPVLIGIRN